MNKDYDSNYLHDTMALLMEVKRMSYEPFLKIEMGNIADIGCGMGKDVFQMAAMNTEGNNYTGIDHDPVLIEEAKNGLKDSTFNLSYECRDLLENPLVNDSYDGIRAERLFQHVSKSEELIMNCYNALKRNGILLTLESDWVGINLYSANQKMQLALRNYLVEKKVVNGLASRKLIEETKNAGFKIEKFKILPFTVVDLNLANSVVKLETIINETASAGYCTVDEANAFYNELEQLNSEKLFRLQMNMILLQAVKN